MPYYKLNVDKITVSHTNEYDYEVTVSATAVNKSGEVIDVSFSCQETIDAGQAGM
jgi:hypothetical protein